MKRAISAAVMLVLGCCAALAQTAAIPRFDVASIRPVPAMAREPIDFRIQPGGRLTITNLTLKIMVREAFGVKNYQIAGGPVWLDTDRFDVVAKADDDPSRKQMMTMLQALLAERFQLKVHRETKEGHVYALVAAKGGAKLKPSTADQSYVGLSRNTPTDQVGVSYTITGQKAAMAMFAERLGELELGRPVLDRTGLQGEFDFRLDYGTADNPGTEPSIFTAIQEQLGLKLESAKGPVETLVIDGAEKPSAN